ncbi:unnamed protein product, partial [Discosporangium mesarthrocarpum]
AVADKLSELAQSRPKSPRRRPSLEPDATGASPDSDKTIMQASADLLGALLRQLITPGGGNKLCGQAAGSEPEWHPHCSRASRGADQAAYGRPGRRHDEFLAYVTVRVIQGCSTILRAAKQARTVAGAGPSPGAGLGTTGTESWLCGTIVCSLLPTLLTSLAAAAPSYAAGGGNPLHNLVVSSVVGLVGDLDSVCASLPAAVVADKAVHRMERLRLQHHLLQRCGSSIGGGGG